MAGAVKRLSQRQNNEPCPGLSPRRSLGFAGAVLSRTIGRVLPAGTYVFVLPSDPNQHYLVRIFNADRTELYATVFAISAERQQVTSDTAFTFADRGSAGPEAIVTWFYPGETIGHEFLYPKQLRQELASAKLVTVVAGK